MVETGRIILGVDGGGSSCRAALVAAGRRHEVTLGPANVSTDFDRAVATIREAILALAAKAGVAAGVIHAAVAHLGLAGVTGPAIAGRVAAALPLGDAAVTDDRPTTVAGALGAGRGAVAAIGTGSFLGRQAEGGLSGIGGWGFHIGDQASGAWLGRRCLEEVMLSLDGIAAATALTQRILARFANDPAAIVAFSMSARPADYAGLAPDVVDAAGADDPLGRQLMAEGAAYILKGLAALGWSPGETLCLTGGLGSAYAVWIGHPVLPAQGSALDGALALAARRAGVRP
jgi:glucosamine kinase